MMSKILLPLLLIVSAVAADDIGDLCDQFISKFNSLQRLSPVELDVFFPHKDETYIRGHAKFRIVSDLVLPNGGCTSEVTDRNTKNVNIRVNISKGYIITPSKALLVTDLIYTLSLNVKEVGNVKKVTVSDLKVNNQNNHIYDDAVEVTIYHKNFINTNLRTSLLKEFERKLGTSFNLEERVEVNDSLVKELMLNVFQATAQDF